MSRKRITDELLEDVAYGKAHLSDYSERMLASELMDLRTRIAMLESQLAAANEMPTVPYDVLDDMLDLVKLLTKLSATQKLPSETEVKLDNVYATIKAIPPHESRIQEAQK
jgi:hypothetical protein